MIAIIIVSIIFTIAYFLLLVYFISAWIKEREYKARIRATTFASIIIPVRNEKENLLRLFGNISSQEYPKELFEVIVSDDSSGDGTGEAISSVNPGFNFKLIKNEESKPGKKNAIDKAIHLSRGELIITTDADCSMGPEWLSTLVSFYEEKKPEMIIAPVCFNEERTFFDRVQSLEFLSLSAITGGSALAGNSLMCSGANLAYSKKAFFKVDGFKNQEQTPSGDDTLLMMKFKKEFPAKVRFLKSREAIVFTRPARSVSEFINQRKRWVSKSRFYKDGFVTGVAWLVLLFNFLILLLSALAFVNKGFAEILAVSSFAKFCIDFLFLFLAASFFNRKSLLWFYFPVQIMYIFYVPFISVAGLTGNFTWKGRLYQG